MGSPQNQRSMDDIKVKLRDHYLLTISEAKKLGIIFDRSMSWDRHVSNVTQRCFGVLTGLSHLRSHLPSAVLSAMINALVFSQIRSRLFFRKDPITFSSVDVKIVWTQ